MGKITVNKRAVICSLAVFGKVLFSLIFVRWISQRHQSEAISTHKVTLERILRPFDARLRLVDSRSVADNGSGSFRCISAEIENINFPICTYQNAEDRVVSMTFLNSGYFEADIVSKIVRRLRYDDSLQLVDIGANIGTYTLPVSRLTSVLSVEPNSESVRLLAISVVRGNVADKVIVVENAISNRRQSVRLAYDETNRGDSFVVTNGSALLCDDGRPGRVKCLEHSVETVLLDDLLPLMSKKRAVVKIDVQGHEVDVFTESSAAAFFDEIDVVQVFIEWEEFIAPVSINANLVNVSPTRVNEMLKFFRSRNYSAYDTNYRMLKGSWTEWPNNILMQKD